MAPREKHVKWGETNYFKSFNKSPPRVRRPAKPSASPRRGQSVKFLNEQSPKKIRFKKTAKNIVVNTGVVRRALLQGLRSSEPDSFSLFTKPKLEPITKVPTFLF